MDEDSYMQNIVGVEMMELDAIMEEQATKEVAVGTPRPHSTKC
jgi:hypothetical protein